MKLELKIYPNECLWQQCKPITKIDSKILDIIFAMRKVMKEYNGIGLAAPQVGLPLQIILVKDRFYVNPYWVANGNEIDSIEGCLSLPGKHYKVKRWDKINIYYLGLDGKVHDEQLEGFDSICFQHEYQHISNNTDFRLISDIGELV